MKLLAAVTITALVAGSAYAFGTIKGVGQNLEHERITRRAFACPNDQPGDNCFQKKTLDSLAGAPGAFGAVGTPDRGALIVKGEAHCDGGDYFDVAGYPQTKAAAQANLEACRAWMVTKLEAAVEAAGDLLDANGALRDSELPTIVACRFGGQIKGRAKCNVLEHFGILLHASQDFYSHTNWTDAADKGAPASPANPAGLNNRGPAPYLDLRTDKPFPAGLISGCFEAKSAISEPKYCNYGPNAAPRVKHLALNKDKGTIDPQIGAGTTDRGKINDNFRHAVEAAVADTKDKWETLKEQLILMYGPSRGTKMICALTRDKPMKAC
jgi:hypothetical protein